MKNQALFSSKDKSKKLKCRLLQFLFGALRVKYIKMVPSLINLYAYKIQQWAGTGTVALMKILLSQQDSMVLWELVQIWVKSEQMLNIQ